jgi:hypothetical protein
MSLKPLRPVGRALSDLINELAYNAKLNKPDNRWVTSEWDRVVDLVAAAMKAKRQDVPHG